MPTLKNRIEDVLRQKEKSLYKFINSKINKDLRQLILAEEVLSECIEYALNNQELLEKRTEDDVFVFLLWKAKCIVCDKVRRLQTARKNEQALVSRAIASEITDRAVAPSPTLLIHRETKRAALHRCLSMISSEDQRTALELVQFKGHTVREAANIMGKSVDSVKKLLRRGFLNLAVEARRLGARQFATTGVTS